MEIKKELILTIIVTLLIFKILDKFVFTPMLAKAGMWEGADADADYWEGADC